MDTIYTDLSIFLRRSCCHWEGTAACCGVWRHTTRCGLAYWWTRYFLSSRKWDSAAPSVALSRISAGNWSRTIPCVKRWTCRLPVEIKQAIILNGAAWAGTNPALCTVNRPQRHHMTLCFTRFVSRFGQRCFQLFASIWSKNTIRLQFFWFCNAAFRGLQRRVVYTLYNKQTRKSGN